MRLLPSYLFHLHTAAEIIKSTGEFKLGGVIIRHLKFTSPHLPNFPSQSELLKKEIENKEVL